MDIIDPPLLTKKKFEALVRSLIRDGHTTHIDAVLVICEEHRIDPSQITSFISKDMRAFIEAEANELNLMKTFKQPKLVGALGCGSE